jgi:hypothetical protein
MLKLALTACHATVQFNCGQAYGSMALSLIYVRV